MHIMPMQNKDTVYFFFYIHTFIVKIKQSERNKKKFSLQITL